MINLFSSSLKAISITLALFLGFTVLVSSPILNAKESDEKTVASTQAEVQVVNLNTASAEDLSEALKGIGQSKAEAIVAYRDKHGKFKHVEELLNIKGIGEKTLERNREKIKL